jgi:histidyl-tRNA synthetase
VKGTRDLLPAESYKWHQIEDLIREKCRLYAYDEIRTPIFEYTQLFLRGVGDTTDVVEKQMYTFEDRGKRSLSLRPESTTSAVRMYLEEKMYAGPQPVKIYYLGPMFRAENPQAGRLRQFTQFGVEAFGSSHPSIDVEIIALAMDFLNAFKLPDLQLQINSLGCQECRRVYRDSLVDYFQKDVQELCSDCRSRLERNPLRVLDCKVEACQTIAKGAPKMMDSLCSGCADHFSEVRSGLEDLGIAYQINGSLVRGLDYYTQTVFEIVGNTSGSQSTICGGGRYDGLIQLCGGDPAPGIGFALGMERLLLALENSGYQFSKADSTEVFVVTMGEAAARKGLPLVQMLRNQGIIADLDHLQRGVKAQMKAAVKKEALFAIILGDDEIRNETLIVKDLASSVQEEVATGDIINLLNLRLRREKE